MHFNQILIVDSIPAGERNTAKELYEDVRLRAHVFEPELPVMFQRVESRDEFLALLSDLANMASTMGNIPVLHIECHGNDEGVVFADQSFATWGDMKIPLTNLNVATAMNLLVVVSACNGGAITHSVSLVDRAPLYGLVGPVRDVTSEELIRSYLALYETILRTRSAKLAVDAMNAAVPDTFVCYTAEWVFQYVWDHYQKAYETPEARLERV